jgi:RNA-splicing ligase RtcB
MSAVNYFCDPNAIEPNAAQQLLQYADNQYIEQVCAFTDIHFCDEKAVPVGVAFSSNDYFYPLITGKDIGCGVMYLKIAKSDWLRPFDKKAHYRGLHFAHTKMTDDGLGGGNHFLSIEEDAESVYILCHTGTRDRGIGLYQHCFDLVQKYSHKLGETVQFLDLNDLNEAFFNYYQQILDFGIQRRKNFCLKTMIFLQQANYIRCDKAKIDKDYLNQKYYLLPNEGVLNGTVYKMEDSIHNHLRFNGKHIIHRKGSTELAANRTVVIPLSMSRGSLLVKLIAPSLSESALHSCAHGAGRQLSRFNSVKHWKTVLKEKERKAYKAHFSELLNGSGEFPMGYIQEFDFAYKDASEIFTYQPYLKKVTQTTPIVTIKYSEI